MSDWFQLDKEYMMSTYCRTKLAIERGAGCKLYDVDGKVYRLIFWCRSKCIRIQSPENRTNNNGSSYEVVAFTVSF